ncbi:MAG: extracellular solute-binding protein, partial [Oscillospiraceae bacterium]
DGNIYFIPFTPDGIVAQGWFVRKDWLDTLGLKEPTSVDEYYNVLKAFRNGDPNGNGKADEIPYFNRNASAGWEESVSSLYIFWDAYKSWHVRDGKIVYGPTEPQYKTAIENISKWYSEKLIDPEIYTRGNKARDILLADNTGGSTHDWFGSTAQLNDTLKDKNPGLNFVAMAPPSGVEGTRRAKVQADGWGISSQCKNLEEAIKYFDFWFTEDGRRLMNFGIEGEEYDMVDGKPKFRESVVKGEKPALDILQGIGAQMFLGYHQDFEYEKQWLNPIALKGIEEYTEKNYPAEQFPVLNFTDEEEKEIKNIMGAIDTYRDEMTQKWVLGGVNLNDGFGKFNESIQQMKIEKATSIMQAAYDRDIKK